MESILSISFYIHQNFDDLDKNRRIKYLIRSIPALPAQGRYARKDSNSR